MPVAHIDDRASVQIAAQRRIEAFNAAAVVGVPQSNVYLLDYEV